MIARARYLLLTSARTRTPLAPLALTVFWVFGTFFYPDNEVGGTWGQTGVTCCALAAWLVGAILAGEPAAQAEMATTAAVLVSLLVLAGLGTLAGPIAAAQAITDAPRGTVNGSELVACLTCLALAAAMFGAAALWSRRA